MGNRNRAHIVALLSIVISIAVICSTQFSMVTTAQQMPSQGGYGGNYGQQGPQPGGSDNFLTIQGLEGLQGFTTGENRLSLAAMPVSQQNNQIGFQVIGFAISSGDSGTAAVYSLSTPLAGVIDPSQNTLQVDLTGLDEAIQDAGFLDSSQVYDTIRTDPKVLIIDIDMTFQGTQGSQTTFSVNAMDIVPPDGKMQAFSMQQPTQLIIDSQSMRIFMVAIPQVVDTFNNYFGATYNQVLPIVYAQPVMVYPPIFTPYLTPFPIFFSGFTSFNPFFFGSGFHSFYSFGRFGGHFPIHDRNFGRSDFYNFRRGRIGSGEIGRGGGQFRPGGGNQIGRPGGDNQNRPGSGSGQNRPGGGNTVRPGGGGNQNRPGGGGNQVRPGGGGSQNRPGGGNLVRPGGGGNQNRPGGEGQFRPGGGSQNRPGGGSNLVRPGGGGSQNRPGGGGSQVRPGGGGSRGGGGGVRRR